MYPMRSRAWEWCDLGFLTSEANARALFSIFSGVCLDEFRKIENYNCAKEGWDILQVTHEGPFAVKVFKLQMLTTKFENIKMHENKNFSSFYFKQNDIVNSSFNLGEPIPNSKVVRKILRSLLKRFRPIIIAIKDRKNIDSMRVDELVGSIQTYEMTLLFSQKLKDPTFKAFENEE